MYKLSKLGKRFDRSIAELDELTVKDIQKTMVREAVDKAAKTEVNGYLRDAHDDVLREARDELHKETARAVGDAKEMISQKVNETITEEAAKIDMVEFRKTVRDKAEQKVLAKFDDNLQDIIDKFSGNLSSVQRIYTSIAETVRKTTDKGDDGKVTFRIG